MAISQAKKYQQPIRITHYYRILLALMLSQYFVVSAFATSTINDEPPTTGEMEFIHVDENNHATTRPALLLDSEATINASGMVAMVELIQHFKNDSDHWVEGRYVFPLPEDAAIDSMEMTIGNRLIKGQIKEKQQAKKIYQAAKSAGKKAALLEQHRPNLFSQQVVNIAPYEKITVKLRYLQTVNYEQGVFSLRFPMTITPRYIPGQLSNNETEQHKNDYNYNEEPHYDKNSENGNNENNTKNNNSNDILKHSPIVINSSGWGTIAPTSIVNDAHLITPPITAASTDHINNPITLNIQLDAGLPLASITSPYHDIVIKKTHGQHHITLAQERVSMDRDFVLNWKATSSSTPRAAVFNESINGEDYSLVMLMPPIMSIDSEKSNHYIPKEMIFIIDTSGSMGGTSIRQAKAGLQVALQQLNPRDRFNVIEFNSQHSLMHYQPIDASEKNIQQALDIVDTYQATGGTNMLPALNAAFQQTSKETHLKQIIFITDGSIGNEEQLFSAIHKNLHNSRLFTMGIGSAPNSFFMRKAAEIGRGTFTYVGNVSEVKQKMTQLFQKISQPTMRDIRIHDSSFFNSSEKGYSTNNSNRNNKSLDIFPNPIADLYHGQPLIATIHKDYELSELTITGIYQNKPWQEKLSLSNGKQNIGVAKLWARNKISALLDKERHKKVNRAPAIEQASIKKDIISVALKHQLMSPYTSFVAVEENISKTIDKTSNKANRNIHPVEIANQLAKGQQMRAVNYPKTATPLWLHILLGSFSLLSALTLIIYQRQNLGSPRHAA